MYGYITKITIYLHIKEFETASHYMINMAISRPTIITNKEFVPILTLIGVFGSVTNEKQTNCPEGNKKNALKIQGAFINKISSVYTINNRDSE